MAALDASISPAMTASTTGSRVSMRSVWRASVIRAHPVGGIARSQSFHVWSVSSVDALRQGSHEHVTAATAGEEPLDARLPLDPESLTLPTSASPSKATSTRTTWRLVRAAVIDGVGDGFPQAEQHVVSLVAADAVLVEPGAEPTPRRAERARARAGNASANSDGVDPTVRTATSAMSSCACSSTISAKIACFRRAQRERPAPADHRIAGAPARRRGSHLAARRARRCRGGGGSPAGVPRSPQTRGAARLDAERP